ncbi:MAG: acyl-CoA dehydrogenase family protein, partial [Acidimicrobiia bacterium]|nr:acyl-CoA dehydrogenase family protein [Acidimicrobiia bacterium]
MQPCHGPEAETYREFINGFLDENLPADWKGIGTLVGQERIDFYNSWRQVLADNKLLAPHWPAEYGGAGLSH